MEAHVSLILPHEISKIAKVDAIEAIHPPRATLLSIHAELALLPADAISRNCRKDYHARHSSGTRPLDQIWWVVMHDTEGPSAQSAAVWFENPASQGSSNSVVDNRVCYATLDDDEIPWGAPGANYHGYHIEQAGYARWTNVIWSKTHRETVKRAAYRAAVRCQRYDLPIRFCTAEMLRAKKKGITTHAECTKAFGGNHTDPGFGYPMNLLLYYTRKYAEGISL
jgi:hypothetical protein